MIIIKILFWTSLFMIFWANIGYPISILILGKLLKRQNPKRNNYEPTVTIMIVAHNEEKVIGDKLENVLKLDYPNNKTTILVTSDHSTDKTNSIVKKFIKKYPKRNIKLHEVVERKGKTNAQNEAAKIVDTEILIMTDANAMLDTQSVKEMVSSFGKNVSYVCGRLIYRNKKTSTTSNSESSYWNLDTLVRSIESRIQTITAGNGALYAIRTKDYIDFEPIRCHDSAMPTYFALRGKRAIANNNALAFEKAGEKNKDEFKRKVRMNRNTFKHSIIPSIKIFNIFKYRWYTYFYLGHRTSRYLLWFNHILFIVTNILLVTNSVCYLVMLISQLLIYLIAILNTLGIIKTKTGNFISYYLMTVIAQFYGIILSLLGKNGAVWEKAESTR